MNERSAAIAMTSTTPAVPHTESGLVIADQHLNTEELIDLMRRQGAIPRLAQEWLLDQVLAETPLSSEEQSDLLRDYRLSNGLESDEAFLDHLQKRHINEALLIKMISRPHQVVRYREERWGPRAQSLYLQHKDQFDTVTYQRLEAADADVMQEIYFRLKDGEESWDSLARQFPGAGPDATALRGPVPVAELEAPVLEVLRHCEPGKVARPIQIGSLVVVVSLVGFQPSSFNDELRTVLLRQAFESWLQEECSRMLERITFPT
ncbi:hypothetical protein [Synechococcus sp. HK01-R]|uniref:hypothetical protein n=1 Tax=Synechococcus sp. HK01-R TaxID=2751171 RepID=UPI00162A197E|nr:hypothetical protein [Synechococcus sp. HK01-R]QNG27774.1 hypothetical protein H0O21_04095 [Synechococcus sp. HK01-R]